MVAAVIAWMQGDAKGVVGLLQLRHGNVLPLHQLVRHSFKDAVLVLVGDGEGGVAQKEQERIEVPVEFGHGALHRSGNEPNFIVISPQ